MFQPSIPKSRLRSAFAIAELVYHATVRNIRKGHGNAFMAIGTNMLSAIIFVTAFYLMFSVLGLRGARLRGDFMLYMLSGIFLYLTHVKALGAVAGAEGSTSPMMQHAPMNTIISIVSSALAALYIQILSVFVILFTYYVVVTPFEIFQPILAFSMLILSWFTGCCLGLVILAIKPWYPAASNILTSVYQRANMIASGKMFVANTLPSAMIAMFDWNPLFHMIDQCRGFTFVNYFPRNSSLEYPIFAALIILMLGLLGEFYTRQHASRSWGARQ